jgi:SAM-dependent methyltransferase
MFNPFAPTRGAVIKVVIGVQATKEDLETTSWPSISALDVAKGMVGRDNVAIVSPTSSRDSGPFERFVQRAGVDVIYGDDFDVNSRFIELQRAMSADIIVRLPVANFFADPGIIWQQVELLDREDLDLALLPERFDGRFGGDVSSGRFFAKFRKEVGSSFRPWAEAVTHTSFKTRRIPRDAVGHWGPVREQFLLKQMKDFWPERWNTAASPNETYQFFIDQIGAHIPSQPGGVRILDLATGEGMGAAMLAREGFEVVGVDYDSVAIENARANFGNTGNLRFEVGDALTYSDEGGFDVVVSVCTMGHIVEHEEFLANVGRLLRPGGYFLNAPALQLDNPVGRTFLTQHVHEYLLDDLVTLTERFFPIADVFGENRGRFGPQNIAHDFAVVIARKLSL